MRRAGVEEGALRRHSPGARPGCGRDAEVTGVKGEPPHCCEPPRCCAASRSSSHCLPVWISKNASVLKTTKINLVFLFPHCILVYIFERFARL